MITAYLRADDRLEARALEPGAPLPDGTLWLDMLRPDEAEREAVSGALGVDLPTPEDMREIEASSRLYMEEGAAVMTTPVISRGTSRQPEIGPLTFVLTSRMLVTVRHTEPLWFAMFAARSLRQPHFVQDPADALLGLLEAVVDRAADVLELVAASLDDLSGKVFAEAVHEEPHRTSRPNPANPKRRAVLKRRAARHPEGAVLQAVITGVGAAGDLTNKVRDSLAGLERLIAFAATVAGQRLNKDQKARLKTLSRDVKGLADHAGFQALQTNFLLDATLGVINIQQTNIIKIFSVAAAAFLPPTLIASIYGMNFEHMPELSQGWGYPAALVLMVVSALLPLWYFRRKGWL